jgi:bifunctional UDP-N-acetylglucosamine pyrophosphorylase / glucosamine-1-phosphate N-acetyltransferase
VTPKGAASPEAAPRVVILAAGVGSRMRSSLPKVLHRVAGRTLIEAVASAAADLDPSRMVIVVGAGRPLIAAALEGRAVHFAVQDPPLGTGDAVARAREQLGGGDGPVVVLAGDTPLLRKETLERLVRLRREKDLDLAFLSFRPPDAGEFGRVVRDARGRPVRIVEARNASPREKKIGEVNAGVYCFAAEALSRALAKIRKNPLSGEYYLTDAVAILAAGKGARKVEAIEVEDWREAWGVNTRRDLAAAEEMERWRGIERALDAGVTLLDPATTRIGPRVTLAPDVVLHPFISLEGSTSLAEGCEIFSFSRIVDTAVAAGTTIGPHCETDGATVGPRCVVGPYSRLRPGTVLEEDVRVGNFVEIKNTILRKGVKALHLAYLGDADVGAGTNIGAGVITCNYDGEKKHRTTIGEQAFIGTDSQLVAPVTVGNGAYVGAGTTVTQDVPDGALALSRVPLLIKEGWAARRRVRKGNPG